MDELVAWLRACLSEDERVARAAAAAVTAVRVPGDDGMEWDGGSGAIRTEANVVIAVAEFPDSGELGAEADHIARWDPSRVLAEVEAKRQILDVLTDLGHYDAMLFLLPLAQVYADRPGFKDEWRLT